MIGIVDADLLDHGTTHPNLALMKLSGHWRRQGRSVRLLDGYGEVDGCERVYVGKVFTDSRVPDGLVERDNVTAGGTGFFWDRSPVLADEIEHGFPDYGLYDDYWSRRVAEGRKPRGLSNYRKFSVGFLTRGCFRGCEFCVNRSCRRVVKASSLSEFLDPERPCVRLWDDNFLGYGGWEDELAALNACGKPFVFQQGLDIRLLTEKKVEALLASNYWNWNFMFAFDRPEEEDLVREKLRLWSSLAPFKRKGYYAKVFLLCAWDGRGLDDVLGLLRRVRVLMEEGYLPYVMRHRSWRESEHKDLYAAIALWCNFPSLYLKESLREAVARLGVRSLGRNVKASVERKLAGLPEVAAYGDLRFMEMRGSQSLNRDGH